MTALTLLLGTNPGVASGPRLWLGCCGVYFQPSEPLKILLIIYLAAYLADRLPLANNLLPLLAPTIVMTGITLILLVAQRDLGTASIFIFLYAAIVYAATARKRIAVVALFMIGLAGFSGYWLFDIVRARVDTWLNPWLDPSGRSYQIVQSLMATANGGLFGRGPGLGYPGMVPIPHSDFIFSAIAEETGLMGALGLVILLALLATRGLRAALNSPDNFRRYLATGVTVYLVAQSVLIVGGNIRLLPLTGVPLPFVSYGGSSLLTAFLSILILLHVSHHAEIRPAVSVSPKAYLHLAGLLLAGLAAIGALAGWWTTYRGPELLERTDNPRRAIADRSVRRGSLLDRQNRPLAISSGTPGNYTRQVLHPALASVLGYNHPIYGQSGLEAGLDAYLRGQEGNPSEAVWMHNLLYGLPPPGLDVRLSLDLDLQQSAHRLIGERPSALVIMNAQNGEILALDSKPGFDANMLDQSWAELVDDPRAPLLNRASMGQYYPGGALGPLLLAGTAARQELPPLPAAVDYSYQGRPLVCAVQPEELTWGNAIGAGCPAAQKALGEALGQEAVLQLYINLGLYNRVPLPLPTTGSASPGVFRDPEGATLGVTEVRASPLQIARAIAPISNAGVQPAPRLATSVNIPQAGWVVLPTSGGDQRVLPEEAARSVARFLSVERSPIWQSVARSPDEAGGFNTWYLAGTQPSLSGAPIVLVLLLEEDNPALATVIGQAIMQTALRP